MPAEGKRGPRTLTSWKPGQSGNPSGRPKGFAEVKRLAMDACPAAVSKLVSLMLNAEDQRVQLEAAKAILDRGIGKPTQAVELSGPAGAPVEMRSELAAEIVAAARATLPEPEIERLEKVLEAQPVAELPSGDEVLSHDSDARDPGD